MGHSDDCGTPFGRFSDDYDGNTRRVPLRTYDETRGRPRYVIEKNTLLDAMSNCSENRRNSDESQNYPNYFIKKDTVKEQERDQKS